MIDLTDEQKKVFYEAGYFFDYRMHFPDLDLTIDTDTLHSESVTIKESICDNEDLTWMGASTFQTLRDSQNCSDR